MKKDEDIARATIAEMSPFKVRLENILCETDCKEQAYSYVNELIADSSDCSDYFTFS